MSRYERARQGLIAVCVGFALLGVLLAAAGHTPLFEWWRRPVAQALLGQETLGGEVARFAALTDGILGGSIAGKWAAALWLALVPMRERRAWAWRAFAVGLASWFLVDSAVSVLMGVWINVVLVNLVPLGLVTPLLALMRQPRPGQACSPTVFCIDRVSAAEQTAQLRDRN